MGKEFTDLFKTGGQVSGPSKPELAVEPDPLPMAPVPIRRKKAKAKWQELLKVNVLLDERQKDFLDSLARQAMRNRAKGKERITTNTFLRCLADLLKTRAANLDLADVMDEEDLKKRLLDSLTK
jgi:hypothetical protein